MTANRTHTINIPAYNDLTKLTPAQLSDLLTQCRMAQKVAKSVEAFVTAKLNAGVAIPGWALKSSRVERKWRSEAEAIGAMQLAGLNDPYERKLLTVAAAEEKVSDPTKLATAWEDVPTTPKPAPVPIKF